MLYYKKKLIRVKVETSSAIYWPLSNHPHYVRHYIGQNLSYQIPRTQGTQVFSEVDHNSGWQASQPPKIFVGA